MYGHISRSLGKNMGTLMRCSTFYEFSNRYECDEKLELILKELLASIFFFLNNFDLPSSPFCRCQSPPEITKSQII